MSIDKTMDEEYGDGSEHVACPYCTLCVTCGDCDEYGCGTIDKDYDGENINHE